jgi:uracil-DNA glycosylase
VSLDLDERQRAMLREMNVEVWWPKPAVWVAEPPAQIVKPLAIVTQPVRVERAPVVQAGRPAQSSSVPISVSISTSASTLSWPDLQQAVATCQACALCEGRQHTVFGVGQVAPDPQSAPQVDWLIVGEAPGENEDRTGEPFVGQAGQLLDNMLKAMGLSRRENVYIVNVIKCRPPGNRNPEAAEIAQCEPYLRRQIELLQPKVILAMGRYAANSLLQMSVPDVHKMALGKLRGQVYHYDSAGRQVPVIATYHPAYLLRNLPEKAKAWADMCLAMQVMKQQA